MCKTVFWRLWHHVDSMCGISDSNCVITVHAQLFLASGLCVYKCVCIVIHFGSVRFVRYYLRTTVPWSRCLSVVVCWAAVPRHVGLGRACLSPLLGLAHNKLATNDGVSTARRAVVTVMKVMRPCVDNN